MLKATGVNEEGRILVLGLSEENVQKLKSGYDVYFDATNMGYPGNICLTYGPTEQAIADRLGVSQEDDEHDS